MNADVIHVIQLTRIIKHYLKTKQIMDCTDKSFIKGVEFSGTKRTGTQKVIAKSNSVVEWMDLIITKGMKDVFFYSPVEGVHITSTELHIDITHGILIRYDGFTELWTGTWKFDIKQRYWKMFYQETNIGNCWINNSLTFQMGDLKQSLWNMKDLAKQISEKSWEKIFEQAYMILSGVAEFENSFFPYTMSKEMQQIFYACEKGWVFGGMSTFNDVPPLFTYELGLEKKFKEYTNDYHKKLRNAIVYSVNS